MPPPYFRTHETLSQRQRKPEVELRNFHSTTKSRLFESTETRGLLLDLAAGRGADCGRYRRFASVHAVDIDADALHQLMQRTRGVDVSPVVADFTRTLDIPVLFDAVSLMFAAHYACRDWQAMTTLARNVSRHLRPGGRFVGVNMDGEAVRCELAPGRRSRWYKGWANLSLGDGNELYVTIKSIADEPKLEWLVDWSAFVEAMESHGLRLQHTSMLDPTGFVCDPELQAFSRLHRLWIFQK